MRDVINRNLKCTNLVIAHRNESRDTKLGLSYLKFSSTFNISDLSNIIELSLVVNIYSKSGVDSFWGKQD